MTKSELIALAERVEGLSGPDREVDLAIHRLIVPDERLESILRSRRGLDGRPGQAWDIRSGALLYETYDDSGRCWANGGIPIPRHTASLDAAKAMVPEGWFTRLAMEDRHSHSWRWVLRCAGVDAGTRAATPELALTSACLLAHAEMVG